MARLGRGGRVLGRGTFTFADARDLAPFDRAVFDRLVAGGYFAAVGPGVYVLTARGRAAVERGEWEGAPADGRPDAA
jgi:hypothetical protein